jgi:hypothetical protein
MNSREEFPLRGKCVGEELIPWLASVLKRRGGGEMKPFRFPAIVFSFNGKIFSINSIHPMCFSFVERIDAVKCLYSPYNGK